MHTSPWFADDVSFDAETDRADASVVEVTVSWGEQTLAVRHLREGETLTVGSGDECDILAGVAGEPIRVEHGPSGVHVLPGANASVSVDGAERDRAPFALGQGHHARVVFDGVASDSASFAVRLRVVAAGRVAPVTFLDRAREGAFGSLGLSFVVHASLVASLAFFLPSLSADDSEAIDRDRIFTMKAMLDAAAARELDRPENDTTETAAANEGDASGGGRAIGEEGAMGRPDSRAQGHYAAKKTSSSPEVSLPTRAELREMASTFGMIELLGTMPMSSASDAPSVPWESVLNGVDDVNHRGNLWSQDIGDAFGFGLGLQGVDEGGGGTNLGIGLNDVGGLGRSLGARLGNGTCLAPPCDGIGRGTAPMRGSRAPKGGPTMRVARTEVEGGRLPAEVIQRIVRMSHGRFRNCYEAGLRQNPSLGGRVVARFVIDRSGAVNVASEGGGDLPDESVRKCVVQTFFSLSFPPPEGGQVRVTYPLMFAPSE